MRLQNGTWQGSNSHTCKQKQFTVSFSQRQNLFLNDRQWIYVAKHVQYSSIQYRMFHNYLNNCIVGAVQFASKLPVLHTCNISAGICRACYIKLNHNTVSQLMTERTTKIESRHCSHPISWNVCNELCLVSVYLRVTHLSVADQRLFWAMPSSAVLNRRWGYRKRTLSKL